MLMSSLGIAKALTPAVEALRRREPAGTAVARW
jgi:hypothetical protein